MQKHRANYTSGLDISGDQTNNDGWEFRLFKKLD